MVLPRPHRFLYTAVSHVPGSKRWFHVMSVRSWQKDAERIMLNLRLAFDWIVSAPSGLQNLDNIFPYLFSPDSRRKGKNRRRQDLGSRTERARHKTGKRGRKDQKMINAATGKHSFAFRMFSAIFPRCHFLSLATCPFLSDSQCGPLMQMISTSSLFFHNCAASNTIWHTFACHFNRQLQQLQSNSSTKSPLQLQRHSYVTSSTSWSFSGGTSTAQLRFHAERQLLRSFYFPLLRKPNTLQDPLRGAADA